MPDESPERKTGAKLFPKVCVVVYVVIVVVDHKINVSGQKQDCSEITR